MTACVKDINLKFNKMIYIKICDSLINIRINTFEE